MFAEGVAIFFFFLLSTNRSWKLLCDLMRKVTHKSGGRSRLLGQCFIEEPEETRDGQDDHATSKSACTLQEKIISLELQYTIERNLMRKHGRVGNKFRELLSI